MNLGWRWPVERTKENYFHNKASLWASNSMTLTRVCQPRSFNPNRLYLLQGSTVPTIIILLNLNWQETFEKTLWSTHRHYHNSKTRELITVWVVQTMKMFILGALHWRQFYKVRRFSYHLQVRKRSDGTDQSLQIIESALDNNEFKSIQECNTAKMHEIYFMANMRPEIW